MTILMRCWRKRRRSRTKDGCDWGCSSDLCAGEVAIARVAKLCRTSNHKTLLQAGGHYPHSIDNPARKRQEMREQVNGMSIKDLPFASEVCSTRLRRDQG